MTLFEKIELVKVDLLGRFPEVSHTIRILLWDDGTDLVECCYGDGEFIHSSTYYNNELKFESHRCYVHLKRVDQFGNEFDIMTEQQWQDHYDSLK